jgi:pimeloyl-ACP methyl ester carboxylesterase
MTRSPQRERQSSDSPERTFVLIPGAGGVAWYWHRVVPLLRAAGHQAIAVDLPGDDPAAGLAEYARLAVATAAGGGEIVLVAQSLGGFTAPLAAARVPVVSLVFVNAMIPRPGETPGAWWDDTGWAGARVAAAGQGGYGIEFDPAVYFLHDVPPEVAAAGEPYQRPEADVVFGSACDFTAWPPVPIRAVAGADDRFFPAGFQQALARDRLGIEADVLPGGHLIALAQPARLAGYLLGA